MLYSVHEIHYVSLWPLCFVSPGCILIDVDCCCCFSLYIEQLPKHPEYRTANPDDKARVKTNCTKLIPLAEEIKSRIKARYEREYEVYLAEKVFVLIDLLCHFHTCLSLFLHL